MLQNILVIKHGAFGDVILSFHALHAIRNAYPRAKITVLTSSAFQKIYEKCPDCDDVWVDNKLHTQTSCFKKGVDFVYGNYDVINENGKIVKESNKNLPTGFITNSLFDNNFISIGAVMISKELLINNLFNPKYNLLGDFELWIRISVKTQFVFLNNIVEHSRVHDNNTSRILYTDWIHEKRFFYYNFLKNYNFLKFHGVFKYIIRTELRVLYEKLIRIVKN